MKKNIFLKLQDKKSFIHIFSALMQEPFKLSQREYLLTEEDFPERFYKIIFSAIHNLYYSGAEKISPIEIDGYLSNTPTQYRIFNENDGLEYLEKALELGEPENFDYHYSRIKKFTLLRQYTQAGVDISDIYNLDLFTDAEAEYQQNKRFNEMSVQEIINFVEGKLLDIKDNYIFYNENYGGHISENLDDILEEKMKEPAYGASFPSGFYTTATRGARKRKLYCVSGNSGSGKTRKLLSDILSFCVPIIYDLEKKKWVRTGAIGKGLFISTELEEEEIKIPALCFVAGVDEGKIYNNELFEEEKQRLKIAKKILEKTDFWIEELFDFDVTDIEHLVEKYVYKYGVEYVAFDYIHSTLKMFDSMARKGAKNLQEHQLLRIMTIHLKNLCNKYDIWIGTSTQLNEAWKEDGNLDQSALEGSKSIVNKLDVGAIQIPLRIQDEQLYEEIKSSANFNFGEAPTHTINIYKNRGNRWKMVRIWIHFDLGTLRTKDLFVTDYRGRVIKMYPKKIKYIDTNLDTEMTDEEVLKELKSIYNTKTEKNKISKKIANEIDSELKNELKETYVEMFEGKLPDSINLELDNNTYNESDENKHYDW